MNVLESRAITVVRAYGVTRDALSDEEIAAELVEAIFPCDEDEGWMVGMPLWHALSVELGVCSNCMCTDCGCCWGCGGIDADVVRPEEHGSWCAL